MLNIVSILNTFSFFEYIDIIFKNYSMCVNTIFIYKIDLIQLSLRFKIKTIEIKCVYLLFYTYIFAYEYILIH